MPAVSAGTSENLLALHQWFDASKEFFSNFRHRALRHHTQGIFEAERVFGVTITTSDGREIPIRLLGEQHVREDCGRVPTLADWLRCIKGEPWMLKNVWPGEALASRLKETASQEGND